MSALIEKALYSREPAWHRQGKVIDLDIRTWADVVEHINLDFDIVDTPIVSNGTWQGPVLMPVDFARLGGITDLDSSNEFEMIDGVDAYNATLKVVSNYLLASDADKAAMQRLIGSEGFPQQLGNMISEMTVTRTEHSAVTRTDTGQILTTHGPTYRLLSYAEFGNFVEKAMQDESASFDAVCILDKGKSITATMYLDEPITVPGDDSPLYPYVGFSSRCDGRGGLTVSPTAVRIVCANTQALFEMMAEDGNDGKTFRHSRNLDLSRAADDVRYMLAWSRDSYNAYAKTASRLATKAVDPGRFLDRWHPIRQGQSVRSTNNILAKRSAFWAAYNNENGTSAGDGTGWAVLQAALEADQHDFTRHSDETRTKIAFRGGSPDAVSQDQTILGGLSAYRLVRQMAGI